MRNWKETIVALVMVAASATAAAAQGGEAIGLTAGGGFARFTTHARDSLVGHRHAWSAGVYATLPLGGHFAFQPELIFSQKGAVEEIVLEAGDSTIERTYSARYIELPLLVRYDLPVARAAALFVIAGPAFAYLVQAANEVGDSVAEDMTDQLASSDVGAVLGAGLRYRTSFGTARLGARGSVGLGDVDRSGAPAEVGLPSANRNVVFGVVAGFEVPVPF